MISSLQETLCTVLCHHLPIRSLKIYLLSKSQAMLCASSHPLTTNITNTTAAAAAGAWDRVAQAMTNSDFRSALTSGFHTESSKSRSREPSLDMLLLLLLRPAFRLGSH